MIYLFLSIICSVSVGILLKIARKNKNSTLFQMITWNYFFAGCFSYWVYKPDISFQQNGITWSIFIALIILLPSVFLIQANSIKYVGIVKTDIAQRLSLIISLSAAFFIFKETFSLLKIVGLTIGFVSIFLILSREKTDLVSNKWMYPVFVFIGFGIIDVFFKQVALFQEITYTTSLFIVFSGAFILSSVVVLFQIIIKKQKLGIFNISWGAGLGILNFSNILFYLKAHQLLHNNPSTVFAGMNFGVIILGSLVGIFFFKEKMSKFNYLGLVLALFAIICIALSQIN
jgi:drug/metabolite transporter (DMT)-like permease